MLDKDKMIHQTKFWINASESDFKCAARPNIFVRPVWVEDLLCAVYAAGKASVYESILRNEFGEKDADKIDVLKVVDKALEIVEGHKKEVIQ